MHQMWSNLEKVWRGIWQTCSKLWTVGFSVPVGLLS